MKRRDPGSRQTDTSSRLRQTAGVLYMDRSVEKQAADRRKRQKQTTGDTVVRRV
jgi:hypothetical protein